REHLNIPSFPTRRSSDLYNKPGEVFLNSVHRLDRPVSGLVVFARTSKALERMNALFRKREIQKTYWAVVGRRPQVKEGKLVHWLDRKSTRLNSSHVKISY